jgi:hypothetical protein
MVPGGIAGGIRFGFHNAPAQASAREIVYHDFADQEARQRDRVVRQFFAPQSANRELWTGGLRTHRAQSSNNLTFSLREQVLILGVFADVRGGVRTSRHNAQVLRAGEFESRLREFACHALVLDGWRDFRVVQRNQSGSAMVGQQRRVTFDRSLKALRSFVVTHLKLIEIHGHKLPNIFKPHRRRLVPY